MKKPALLLMLLVIVLAATGAGMVSAQGAYAVSWWTVDGENSTFACHSSRRESRGADALQSRGRERAQRKPISVSRRLGGRWNRRVVA